ncbi:MAG: Stk1 family PASTA domain-containing Ser/Thr kinase [Coriobacteriia bacterium]|nr:Stk1 family PASTA domain-containing Ser/Thr kinase [Coriobacteriia bacterium]
MAIERGTVFGGRYVVQSQVGTGGMATVYRGMDQTLDRLVAIKVMLSRYASDPSFAARFKQEAQAAAALQSPYIVSVYDWGKEGDTYYIVMEYLRGTDLKTGIRSHGALAPRKVAQIGAQVCSALSVAHAHEIIHRDIKPQNIMIQPNGDAKVMDFGIARSKNSHLTQTNSVLGTAHYVSPEQAQGKELGPTSDLYSLGVVMYEASTGKLPFDGDDAVSVALKQVNEEPVPPSEINPNVDDNLEAIIMKCMAKDPGERFQSADELRRVLNNYIMGRPLNLGTTTRVMSPSATQTTVMQGGATGTTPLRGQTEPTRRIASTQAMNRAVGMNSAAGPVGSGRGGAGGRGGSSGSMTQERQGLPGPAIAGIVAVVIIALVLVIVFALRGCAGGTNTPGVNGTDTTGVAASSTTDTKTSTSTETVKVPSVTGKTVDAARSELQAAGLDVGTTSQQASDSVPKDQIISQNPTANSTVNKGSKINVVVSTGPTNAALPSLTVGMSEADAVKALEAAGFKARHDSNLDDFSDQAAEGTFLKLNPAQANSTSIAKGTEITYGLSKGAQTVSVPYGLVGATWDEANSALSNAQLTAVQNLVDDDHVAQGSVVSVEPGEGTEGLAPWSSVTVNVSNGPSSVTIPTGLEGSSYDSVAAQLSSLGLNVSAQHEYSSTAAAGTVTWVGSAGQQVSKGTTVNVGVSDGPEPTPQITVPDVRNWSSDSAAYAISEEGLTPNVITGDAAPSANAEGIVYAVEPGAGSSVDQGSTVTIYVYGPYVDSSGGNTEAQAEA